MSGMTGADAVVAALRSHQVDTVFGIPGVHSLPLYDAVRRSGTIRHVLARHEQGAGFMAEGFARATGRPGVALVTSGPAVTNIATPAASAYTDSLPLLIIATDLAMKDRGARAGVLHELKDQDAVASSLVGWQRTVTSAQEIGPTVLAALEHLRRDRPRGAIICIPNDLLAAPVSDWSPSEVTDLDRSADPVAVAAAADLLTRAVRPLIVAGAGMRRGDELAPLGDLADLLGAPILLGPKSRDLIDDGHPLAWWGRLFVLPDVARELIQSCDATLILGTKLAAERAHDGRLDLPGPRIRVDIDPAVVRGAPIADLGVVGDGISFVRSLLLALRERKQPDRPDRREAVAQARQSNADGTVRWVGPHSLTWLAALRESLPDDAVVVADMTMLGYASADLLDVRPGGRFIHPFELCSIGCGLPTSIGVKTAVGERAVVGIGGDGGSLLNIGELATAVQEQIPIVYVVFNDNSYTAVAGPQERIYGDRFATDLVSPDFVGIAAAFGAVGVRVNEPAGLRNAVRSALRQHQPTVIEVDLTAAAG